MKKQNHFITVYCKVGFSVDDADSVHMAYVLKSVMWRIPTL